MDQMADKALNVMATASTKLRDAIHENLPVANNQFMTVQMPGTIMDYK